MKDNPLAPTEIGPHLLGRRYEPDPRDWTPEKLHATLGADPKTPPAALLDETVRQAIGDSPFFQTWAGIRWLWRWIKANFLHPSPTPPSPPSPSDAPSWDDPVVLDQGNYGTCVGNGFAGWGDSTPVTDSFTERDARAIYYQATCIDGSCDDPDAPGGGQQGTSVRAGAKAMQKRARLSAYAFTTNVADVVEWLNNHGPVVFGTNWYDGMFNPDAQGFVSPTGSIAGGHCFLCIDHLPGEDAFLFVNSWGTSWGQGGHFRMRSAVVAQLLKEQGEACLAAELPA